MYLYETHLHMSPLSACAKAGIRETLTYYKEAGYAGVFITDHFIDANVAHCLRDLPYDEKINGYFDMMEEALPVADELGLTAFLGFEMSFEGTHFLVYGIDRAWCLAHTDMDKMRKSELLRMMMDDGALLIHAHPFREAGFIDHIRLYPRHVHGVEILNAGRTDFANEMARQYCENYGLIPFAGTDNHHAGAGERNRFAGMAIDAPLRDVADFKDAVLSGRAKPFIRDEAGFRLL